MTFSKSNSWTLISYFVSLSQICWLISEVVVQANFTYIRVLVSLPVLCIGECRCFKYFNIVLVQLVDYILRNIRSIKMEWFPTGLSGADCSGHPVSCYGMLWFYLHFRCYLVTISCIIKEGGRG